LKIAAASELRISTPFFKRKFWRLKLLNFTSQGLNNLNWIHLIERKACKDYSHILRKDL
jgi:hypothetical protein